MAHAEVFEEPGLGWRYRAIWNDQPTELSQDVYDSAEEAQKAAVHLPLTIVVLDGSGTPTPPPRRRGAQDR
jgi:hypothetical protein